MNKTIFTIAAMIFALQIQNFAQVDARMLQYPDVSKTRITFYYGGDLWVVSKEGGTANKLTNAIASIHNIRGNQYHMATDFFI